MAKSISIRLPEIPRPKVFVALALVATAIFGMMYWQDVYTFARYHNEGEREVQRIILKIEGKVNLPNGAPGLATVSDSSKINRGGVLAEAKNGDKILLYYAAGKAILYRPSVEKVIAIGPIVLDASAGQVKDTKVLVRNGSGDKKKLDSALNLLKERYSEADIAKPEEASRSDFPKTIVIDLTEKEEKTEFVGAMIELLGAQRGILPQGESKPNADVLVIIGKD